MPSSSFTTTYSKPGTTAPVFVAGSFTLTPWEPQELNQTDGEGSGSFSKTFSVNPGIYQYKFRIGMGDWWVTDETQPTATDEQGNVNNVLIIQERRDAASTSAAEPAQGEKSAETQPVDTDSGDNFAREESLELPSAVPVSEINVQSEDGPSSSLSQTISTVAAKDDPVRSVSHDLPTPPISEGGDDIEGKEGQAAPAKFDSQESDNLTLELEESQEKQATSVQAPHWSRNGMILLAMGVAAVPILAWSFSK